MAEYIKRRNANRMLYDVYEHAMKHELSRGVTIPTVEAKNILLRFEKALNAVPAVDAVEVVRCAQCKYYLLDDVDICASECGLHQPRPDDFCSYGERRADA